MPGPNLWSRSKVSSVIIDQLPACARVCQYWELCQECNLSKSGWGEEKAGSEAGASGSVGGWWVHRGFDAIEGIGWQSARAGWWLYREVVCLVGGGVGVRGLKIAWPGLRGEEKHSPRAVLQTCTHIQFDQLRLCLIKGARLLRWTKLDQAGHFLPDLNYLNMYTVRHLDRPNPCYP